MRFDLSDEEWALLVPLLPKNRKSARVDDRRILNAIFYMLRTGMPWRDLPELRALHNSLQSVQPLVSPRHLEAHRRRVGIEISRQLVSDRQHDRESPPLSQRRKRGRKIRRSEFFGKEIEFGADIDEVLFAPNIRDLPVVSADLYLNKLLVRYCEEALARRPAKRSPFRSSVENAIVPLLPHGKARADVISRRLGVSQRTLARRLSSEQLSFAGVLESLKMDLAKWYLADQALSVSQVA